MWYFFFLLRRCVVLLKTVEFKYFAKFSNDVHVLRCIHACVVQRKCASTCRPTYLEFVQTNHAALPPARLASLSQTAAFSSILFVLVIPLSGHCMCVCNVCIARRCTSRQFECTNGRCIDRSNRLAHRSATRRTRPNGSAARSTRRS